MAAFSHGGDALHHGMNLCGGTECQMVEDRGVSVARASSSRHVPAPLVIAKLTCLIPPEGDPAGVHPWGRLVLGLREGRPIGRQSRSLAWAGDRDVTCLT